MDLESLGSLRRSFHTLKGSGRMVGARTIAEFGWAIENLLNRIIDKTLSRTPGHDEPVAQCRRGAAAAGRPVGERPANPAGGPIMARAFAYADGREAEQLGAALAPEDRADASTAIVAPAPAAADAVPAAASRRPRSRTGARSPPHRPAAAERRTAAMDPQLHEIYSKETSSHLAEIREYLRKRTGQPAPHDLPESVYRAIHTLSGSSKMAEARHGIRITEPLNHFMRKVFDSGRGLSDAGLAMLADAVAPSTTSWRTSTRPPPSSPSNRRCSGACASSRRISTRSSPQAANDTSASAIVPALTTDSAAAESAERARGDARRVGRVRRGRRRIRRRRPARAPASTPGESAPAAEEFDHEIANIYSEEATELIEAAETSLTAWNRDRKDKQRVAELQRQLHTLKGGARMAGITAMGDLSHELESLVIQIDGGSVAADDQRTQHHAGEPR